MFLLMFRPHVFSECHFQLILMNVLRVLIRSNVWQCHSLGSDLPLREWPRLRRWTLRGATN